MYITDLHVMCSLVNSLLYSYTKANMKITNSALLFAAAIGAVSAKDTPLRRARNLQDTIIDPIDGIEADGKSSNGEPFDGDLATITHLKGDCVYEFDDEDNFEVLAGSPDAMTCVGTRCNQSLAKERVLGVAVEEKKGEKLLEGFFDLNCPTVFTKFALGCPEGYTVGALLAASKGNPFIAYADCSDVNDGLVEMNGNFCIIKEFSFLDTTTKWKFICKEL